MYRALGPNLLIDPWNPWVTVLPFVVFVLLAWSLAEHDFIALPWLVAVGTFVVQTHVGYAPLVAGMGAGAVARAAIVTHSPAEHLRRWLVIAVAVGIVLWFAPVAQQLTVHPGNLAAIFGSFRHPPVPTLGLATAFGIMGKELGIPGAWLTGNDAGPLGAAAVGTAGTFPALGVLAVACGFGVVAWRRGAASAARLVVFMVAAAGIGVLAGSRIIGFPADYLVRWWWVLGALLWCAIGWAAWTLVGDSRAAPYLAAAACVVIAALSVTIAFDAWPVRVPGQQFSVAIGALASPTAAHLTRRTSYRFMWVDSTDIGAVGYGLYLDLAERGFDVKVPPSFAQSFGPRDTATLQANQPTIEVVAGDDLDRGWQPPPGAIRIAQFDPLNIMDRDRADALTERIRAELGPHSSLQPSLVDAQYGRNELASAGVDAAPINALRRLRAPGIPYVVYLNPTTT